MRGGGGPDEFRRAPDRVPAALIAAAAIFSIAFLVASYLKGDLTRNDFERFDDLRLSFLFFFLLLGLAGVHLEVYLRRPGLSSRTVYYAAFALALIFLASFPVGSRDVFGYAFVGRMIRTFHADPFLVSPEQFAGDPWLAFTTRQLSRPVSVYGPLFVLQTWLVDASSGSSMWASVWLHKAVALLLFFVTVRTVGAILARNAGASSVALLPLFAWNPLVLLETAGSAHNDIAMALAILAAVWCWSTDRPYSALALLAVSFWYKWYGAIFLPCFLIDSAKERGLRIAVLRAAAAGAIAIVLGVILFTPFPGAAPKLAAALMSPEKLRGIFPTELSPPLALLFWGFRAAGFFESDLGFRLFDWSRFALFFAAIAWIWIRQLRATAGIESLIESCFWIALAFFSLLVTQLWPWHLLAVIALGIARGRDPYLLIAVLLTIAGLLSYSLTFLFATLMMIAIVASLWSMKRLRTTSDQF